MAYCGTQEVAYLAQINRDELGFTDVATYNSFIGGTLIPRAEEFIDNQCGGRAGTLRRFNTNYGSVNLDGNGYGVLYLPPKYTPWLYMGTLQVDGSAVTVGNIKVHSQYLEYDDGVYTKGAQNIRLIGSYGYANVPYDIQYTCAQVCANMLQDAKRRKRSDVVTGVGEDSMTSILGDSAIMSAPWIFTKDLREKLRVYRIKWTDIG